MFRTAIDALAKLGGLVRDAVDLPRRQRQKYLDAVTEAFTLLQAALSMVHLKLGDLLHVQDDNELNAQQKRRRFVQELANLDNSEQWLQLEREVALCRSLRVVSTTLDGAANQLLDSISVEDGHAIWDLITEILERERYLAVYISRTFEQLAAMAVPAARTAEGRKLAWRAVKTQRDLLRDERRHLIDAETRFLDSLRPAVRVGTSRRRSART
jgi:hypothetical protein